MAALACATAFTLNAPWAKRYLSTVSSNGLNGINGISVLLSQMYLSHYNLYPESQHPRPCPHQASDTFVPPIPTALARFIVSIGRISSKGRCVNVIRFFKRLSVVKGTACSCTVRFQFFASPPSTLNLINPSLYAPSGMVRSHDRIGHGNHIQSNAFDFNSGFRMQMTAKSPNSTHNKYPIQNLGTHNGRIMLVQKLHGIEHMGCRHGTIARIHAMQFS